MCNVSRYKADIYHFKRKTFQVPIESLESLRLYNFVLSETYFTKFYSLDFFYLYCFINTYKAKTVEYQTRQTEYAHAVLDEFHRHSSVE